MMLGRYRQQPGEKRKRGLDYDDFLESAEIVTGATPDVSPVTDTPFVVDGVVVDPAGKEFAYFASGGEAGQTYAVTFTVTTNGNQIRKDTVEFDVEEDEDNG